MKYKNLSGTFVPGLTKAGKNACTYFPAGQQNFSGHSNLYKNTADRAEAVFYKQRYALQLMLPG